MSRGEWDGDAQRGPGCDDKRGLLVGQILDDQTVESLRMMPEASRRQNHPLKSLALPTPRRAQDVLHTRLRSKTRWQPSVQTCQFCPLAHPELVENGNMVGVFFFLLKVVMIFSYLERNWFTTTVYLFPY